jgi:hypothetical protein
MSFDALSLRHCSGDSSWLVSPAPTMQTNCVRLGQEAVVAEFLCIYADHSEASSMDFLNHVKSTASMKISKLLTDNISQFTDRFTSKKREPTGRHKFDVRCKAMGIEHRLCPLSQTQTNGMVDRFNDSISKLVNPDAFRFKA